MRPEPAGDADIRMVRALRAGDTGALTPLVESHHAAMVRAARRFLCSEDLAEDVAQETWLAVIDGIEAFEGRAPLRSWIFTILVNRARTRARP